MSWNALAIDTVRADARYYAFDEVTQMDRRHNVTASIVTCVIVASVLGAAAIVFKALFGPPSFAAYSPARLRRQVLCSDHEAVLEACRRLSIQVTSGELDPGIYRVRFWSDSVVSRFPETIRSLRPSFVRISEDGVVRLEMGSQWASFGVNAYPDGYETPSPEHEYGDRELLEGLWYYDETYRYVSDYDSKIDVILSHCEE